MLSCLPALCWRGHCWWYLLNQWMLLLTDGTICHLNQSESCREGCSCLLGWHSPSEMVWSTTFNCEGTVRAQERSNFKDAANLLFTPAKTLLMHILGLAHEEQWLLSIWQTWEKSQASRCFTNPVHFRGYSSLQLWCGKVTFGSYSCKKIKKCQRINVEGKKIKLIPC